MRKFVGITVVIVMAISIVISSFFVACTILAWIFGEEVDADRTTMAIMILPTLVFSWCSWLSDDNTLKIKKLFFKN